MNDRTLLREVADRGAVPGERNQLQRFDWLLAALEIFVDEGIEAVRITRLADELGVTRGSFYWHFANRDDLIEALVEYWRDKNTRAIRVAVEQAVSLSDGIFRFFETCLDTSQFDSRLDLAIREWSRRAPAIRAAIDEADVARVECIRLFYCRFAYPMPEALIRARVIYFAQIGFYALDVDEDLETRVGYSADYFKAFTGKRLAPGSAAAFSQRVLNKYGQGHHGAAR